jgi:hypothetical protein
MGGSSSRPYGVARATARLWILRLCRSLLAGSERTCARLYDGWQAKRGLSAGCFGADAAGGGTCCVGPIAGTVKVGSAFGARRHSP